MARLIAWDTSQKSGMVVAIVVHEDGAFETQASFLLNVNAQSHSEQLLWAIESVRQSVGWTLGELDAIGVGVGPGSFTGLRIGISTAKSLAFSLEIPIVPVPSLLALARATALTVRNFSAQSMIFVTTDAAKSELFALWGTAESLCSSNPNSFTQGVFSPSHLLTTWNPLAEVAPYWIPVGSGSLRYPTELWDELPQAKRKNLTAHSVHIVSSEGLSHVTAEIFKNGGAIKAQDIQPNYVRASDAEKKRLFNESVR